MFEIITMTSHPTNQTTYIKIPTCTQIIPKSPIHTISTKIPTKKVQSKKPVPDKNTQMPEIPNHTQINIPSQTTCPPTILQNILNQTETTRTTIEITSHKAKPVLTKNTSTPPPLPTHKKETIIHPPTDKLKNKTIPTPQPQTKLKPPIDHPQIQIESQLVNMPQKLNIKAMAAKTAPISTNKIKPVSVTTPFKVRNQKIKNTLTR